MVAEPILQIEIEHLPTGELQLFLDLLKGGSHELIVAGSRRGEAARPLSLLRQDFVHGHGRYGLREALLIVAIDDVVA